MEKRGIGKIGKKILILLAMISMIFVIMACSREAGTEKIVAESMDDSKKVEENPQDETGMSRRQKTEQKFSYSTWRN